MSESIKERLFSTLLQLLDEVPIEKISIDEICSTAGISRSTFYRNFNHKYELLTWKFREYISFLYSAEHSSFKYLENYFVMSLLFVQNNANYFKKMISYTGQNSFLEVMTVEMSSKIKKSILSKTEDDKLPMEIDYSIEMFANNIIHANIKWIKSGFDYAPESIAKLLIQNIPPSLATYI